MPVFCVSKRSGFHAFQLELRWCWWWWITVLDWLSGSFSVMDQYMWYLCFCVY